MVLRNIKTFVLKSSLFFYRIAFTTPCCPGLIILHIFFIISLSNLFDRTIFKFLMLVKSSLITSSWSVDQHSISGLFHQTRRLSFVKLSIKISPFIFFLVISRFSYYFSVRAWMINIFRFLSNSFCFPISFDGACFIQKYYKTSFYLGD